jgi:hypothetical protein
MDGIWMAQSIIQGAGMGKPVPTRTTTGPIQSGIARSETIDRAIADGPGQEG